MGDESKPTWPEQDAVPEDTQVNPAASMSDAPAPGGKPRLMRLVGVVAVAGVLGYGVGNFGKPFVRRWLHGPEVKLQDGPRVAVELRGDEASLGPKNALVTIVAFSDYECPFCAKAEKTLDEFLEDWKGEPVRVVYKNYPLPLHGMALPAAHAAWAAHMQNKFRVMHQWLYDNRAKVGELDDAALESMGLDAAKFRRDEAAPATRQAVDDDRRAGGLIQLRATPSFVINGHIYTANWSLDAWEDVVKWELKFAKELLKQGVRPEELLDQLVKANPRKPALAPEQPESK